mmetsp:Transcript_90016/g.197108  ORF Transcript_90016/g.197108 Transcript_90016/m.197108 type:complete len:118 (+) Transcript_90016:2092-2445(+)
MGVGVSKENSRTARKSGKERERQGERNGKGQGKPRGGVGGGKLADDRLKSTCLCDYSTAHLMKVEPAGLSDVPPCEPVKVQTEGGETEGEVMCTPTLAKWQGDSVTRKERSPEPAQT